MPLIPYRHMEDLDKWFDEEWPDIWERAGRWLPRISRGLFVRAPKVNISEDNGNVVVEAELPGVDPKDIDVEVKENMVKVEAKVEEKKEEKKKGYYRQEMSSGYYKRIIPLPVDVVESKADASYENGVLKIVIPKVKSTKEAEKKVKVKVKTKTTKTS